MERIFVVPSCDTVGTVRLPDTPSTVFPLNRFALVRSVTAEDLMDTVPPDVYPVGMDTVPDLVEISPLVEPLFAILPLTEPLAPYALFPVSKSPAAKLALAVS